MTSQFKTPKGTREAIHFVAESVNRAAEDAKFAVDELSNFVTKATDDNQALLAFNQKLLQNGFETWQNYTQVYLNFFLSATQRNVEQSFAFQEGLDKIVSDSFNRNQDLVEAKQGPALDIVSDSFKRDPGLVETAQGSALDAVEDLEAQGYYLTW